MTFPKIWAVLIVGLWSLTSSASDIAREADYAERIAATLNTGEIVRLEANGRQFLSIYTETEYPDSKEAAIILHDKGAHPDRRPLIHGLRTELPKHRWSTLALQMPLREQGAEREDYFPLFAEATARLQAAVGFLARKGFENIAIVGHGLGALMALQARDALTDNVKALAMIGVPVPETREKSAQTLELIKKTEIPLLDLYSNSDMQDVVGSAASRRLAAKEHSYYRQVRIDDDEAMIVKRVYSWLKRTMELLSPAKTAKREWRSRPHETKPMFNRMINEVAEPSMAVDAYVDRHEGKGLKVYSLAFGLCCSAEDYR